MAVLLSDAPDYVAGDVLPHKTWTRRELALVEETGVFEGTHFELIEGELIDKIGKKHRHVKSTKAAVIALEAIFGQEFVIHEAPIDVAPEDNPRNEPEPDVIVLRHSFHSLQDNAQASEVALVVEISDTTLRQDLKTKARLYARAGIPEYWVVDLKGRQLHVFRTPSADAYQTRFALAGDASVSPLGKSEHAIAIATLLA